MLDNRCLISMDRELLSSCGEELEIQLNTYMSGQGAGYHYKEQVDYIVNTPPKYDAPPDLINGF